MTQYLVYSLGGFILGFVYKHTIERLYYELARKEREADEILDEMISEVEHLKPCEHCRILTDDMELYKKETETRLKGIKEELTELEEENDNLLKDSEGWYDWMKPSMK